MGVFTKENPNKLIGCVEGEIGKQNPDKWGREDAYVDIGYFISPLYQGHGIASEAARALMGGLFFGVLNYKHAVASCHPDNLLSHRIVYALGFKRYNENAFMYGSRRIQFETSRDNFYNQVSAENTHKPSATSISINMFTNQAITLKSKNKLKKISNMR